MIPYNHTEDIPLGYFSDTPLSQTLKPVNVWSPLLVKEECLESGREVCVPSISEYLNILLHCTFFIGIVH